MFKKSPSGSRTLERLRPLAIVSLILLSLVILNVGFVQNAQALDPHIIKGYCYEVNGTVIPDCNVTLVNTRTGDTDNVTSNATGWYSFNLLNFPNGWQYGDVIQGNITNATGSPGANSTQLVLDTSSTLMDIWIGGEALISGVRFYIIDEDGRPVANAYINVKDSNGDIVITKLSDSEGKAFTSLENGLYTVTVSKTGYNDTTVTARVHGSTDYTIRLGDIGVAEGIVISQMYLWLLGILALIGVFAIFVYLARRL